MEVKDHIKLIKEIKSGHLSPIYIIHGEEQHFIDELTDTLEHEVIPEGERSFNQDILYGSDIDGNTVVDYARQFPMMAEKRMVLVKEAQNLKNLDSLVSYLEKPVPHAIVVLSYTKNIDGRQKWFKDTKSKSHVVVYKSEPLKEHLLSGWLNKYVSSKKLTIDPQANELMCQYLGTDLKKLVNEIDKIILQVGPKGHIDVSTIDKYVGISKEFNVFELCRALSQRDIAKAHLISFNMAANFKSIPLALIIPAMGTYFQKLLVCCAHKSMSDSALMSMMGISYPSFFTEYRVGSRNYTEAHARQIIAWIAEADRVAKGMGPSIDDEQNLKELVAKILMPDAILV